MGQPGTTTRFRRAVRTIIFDNQDDVLLTGNPLALVVGTLLQNSVT